MLYNIYRPSTFEDVVGQDNTIEVVKGAIDQERLSHSILLSGIHGTGKTTLARIIARESGCDEAYVFEIDAASNSGVEDVRNLVTAARVPPNIGKYKTYIIDEAHMYSNAAQNALLKILEEPPKHCIFILCTTEKHKLLATILSRCQTFDLKCIEEADIVKRLRFICNEEKIEHEEDALCFIAREARGSMRDAVSLLELVRDKCVLDELSNKLNIVGIASYLELLQVIIDGEVDKALVILNEMSKTVDAVKLCEGLTSFIRDLFYFKSPEAEALIIMSELHKEKMRIIHKELGAAFIFGMLSELNKCTETKSTGLQMQVVRLNVELALIKLILQRKKQLKK